MNTKERYELLKVLGNGSFGYVFLGIDSQNRKYAIKRVEKVGNKLSREYEILQKLQNSLHCVHLVECFYT